jgi:catechol 2,3-dioxygenase-like lactoylglutathione lyase family enzyme
VNRQEPSSPLGAGVAVTHILVVTDPARSRDFWVGVLGAELYREYGGTSVVLIRRHLALAGQRGRPDRRQARRGLPAAR